MPCPGPFHFSHIADYIYDFCPLPDPDVCPSVIVCDVERTSFYFGLCGRCDLCQVSNHHDKQPLSLLNKLLVLSVLNTVKFLSMMF